MRDHDGNGSGLIGIPQAIPEGSTGAEERNYYPMRKGCTGICPEDQALPPSTFGSPKNEG